MWCGYLSNYRHDGHNDHNACVRNAFGRSPDQKSLGNCKESWKDSTDGGNKALGTGKTPKTSEVLRKIYQLLDGEGEPFYTVTAGDRRSTGNRDHPAETRFLLMPTEPDAPSPPDDSSVTDRRTIRMAQPKPEPFLLECPALAPATHGIAKFGPVSNQGQHAGSVYCAARKSCFASRRNTPDSLPF